MGIHLAPYEIRPNLFRAACTMRLEGVVSNYRDRPYRAELPPTDPRHALSSITGCEGDAASSLALIATSS